MIEIIQADISKLDIEAIVNAANQSLLGGGGVDGAIHRAAGPELLEHNRKLGGCRTGEAVLTPGFALKAKWIIHTVGPVWNGGKSNETQLLSNCYQNCFRLAFDNNISSIAFPAISTGIYGFPVLNASKIALFEMCKNERQFTKIIACCFSSEDVEIYANTLRQLKS